MKRSLLKLSFLVSAAAMCLSGCATGYLLDNNVLSFSSLAALPAQPSYRFERLPSQQGPVQSQLEAMADGALQKAGLRRDDANPRFGVQVEGRLQPMLSPWATWDDWGWGGWGFGVHHRGFGWGMGGPFAGIEPSWYHREASVIIRELPSNRVVFESRASNDGPWMDNAAVFPAMFEAALQGFPTPAPGPRRVDIQLGR
jgi:hypothetical protein